MTEVYEVATFYHHFDVVKEDEAAPPAITVRVCETLSCKMAGADALRASSRRSRRAACACCGAPCIGRCEQAPAAVVGRNAIGHATADKIVAARRREGASSIRPSPTSTTRNTAPSGGYALLRECVAGKRTLESVIAEMESSALRGLGGAGFPDRPQVEDRARASPRRASWRSTSTKASPARSRTATTSSATRIASSKAC